ncbi:MAG: hypothetical protein HQ485_02655 [Acidobacteria bacterium]|nr:hypothetical protein [Acidobacteriota bacterium]
MHVQFSPSGLAVVQDERTAFDQFQPPVTVLHTQFGPSGNTLRHGNGVGVGVGVGAGVAVGVGVGVG